MLELLLFYTITIHLYFIRIVGIVDTVGLKLVLDKEAVTLLSLSVALSVKPEDGSNFQEIFFSISDPSNVQVRLPGLTDTFKWNSVLDMVICS